MEPRSFYGGQKPVAHALQGGKGAEVALKAVRASPERLVRQFATQEQAFAFSDEHPHLRLHTWSYEIDDQGKRRFLVASYASFWRLYSRCIRRSQLLHFYEIIRAGDVTKLYFDLEFVRAKNCDADTERMVQVLKETVAGLSGRSVEKGIVELSSTTEKKWSKHLIFENVCFHDNIQAGEFATEVCENMQAAHPGLLMVRNNDDELVPFVDLAVYTKNRCFRLVGSSKFGKPTRLLPDEHPREGRLSIAKDLFFDSLVCNVSAGTPLRGSPRPAQSAASFVRRTFAPGGSPHAKRLRPAGEDESHSGFQRMDDYVMSIVSPSRGSIYGITHFRGSGTLQYTIRGGYKYCARVGRHHKSNNVILIADVPTRKMYQKCFDPDCRDFCSDPWEIPASVFETKNSEDAAMKSAESGEDIPGFMLYDMMEEGEAERRAEELSDDVLNAMMDCVEMSLLEARNQQGEDP